MYPSRCISSNAVTISSSSCTYSSSVHISPSDSLFGSHLASSPSHTLAMCHCVYMRVHSRAVPASCRSFFIPTERPFSRTLHVTELCITKRSNHTYGSCALRRTGNVSEKNGVDGGIFHPILCKRIDLRIQTKAAGSLETSEVEPFFEEASKWRFGSGIYGDLKRRLPHYLSDFKDGVHPKGIAAVVFLYFACLAPCIAFGGLLSHVTGGEIGVVESIVGTAAAGILYPLFAGQPLTLLGSTGLMVIYCGLLYKVTLQLGLPFLPVYGWVGVWSSIFLIILAATEASDLVSSSKMRMDLLF